jgi:hypothetical protein
MALATSSGVPTRPSGIDRMIAAISFSLPSLTFSSIGVSVSPGATQLTLIPCRAVSRASAFEKAIAAPLAPE